MTEELARYTVSNQMDVMQLGDMLAKSGYFADAKTAAQAVVKVLAGQEFGIGPVASMTGIHIIQGKPSVGAGLQAACVKRSGKYDFRVKTLTDTEATIEFYQLVGDKWDSIGISTFTQADAKKAGTKNMSAYPRNMLYARAISNGVKWYTPDVFMAPVYSPDELGASVNWDTGEIVDAEPVPQPQEAPASNGNAAPQRPYQPETLKHGLETRAKSKGTNGTPATRQQIGLLAGKLNECFAGDDDADNKRRSVIKYVWGVESSKDLTKAQAAAMLDWLIDAADDSNDYPLKEMAVTEARLIVRQFLADAGQTEMELPQDIDASPEEPEQVTLNDLVG